MDDDNVSAFDEALKIKKRATDILPSLLCEQKELRDRIRQFDELISQMEVLKKLRSVAEIPETSRRIKSKVTDLVLSVLKETESPMLAADIIKSVQEINAATETGRIHHAIFRLKSVKQIQFSGEKKNRVYSIMGRDNAPK